MDFSKLPFWGQILLMAGIGGLLSFIAETQYPGLGAMDGEIAQMEQRLTELNADVQAGRRLKRDLPQLEERIAELEAAYASMLRVLPREPETGELLEAVKSYADVTGLGLKKFSPGNLVPHGFYREFPISMDVVGRYHELGAFFARVSGHERVINVKNIRLNGLGGGGADTIRDTIRATFTAVTFVAEEEGGEEKG